MHKITFFSVLVLFIFSTITHAAELTLDALIRGVNQARLTILSGEIYIKTTEEYPAQKTEKEITEWRESQKEQELKNFTPDPFYPNIDVKQFEKDYLIPYLNFSAKGFRKRTKSEHTRTLFQILEPDVENKPRLYQYKLTMVDTPGYPLDNMSDRFMASDTLYLLTYDMQTQVKEEIGDILHSIESVDFFDSDTHIGYWHFSLFGRSKFRITPDVKKIGKEKIDDAECYVLEFIVQDKLKIHIWVDPVKDFCVRRNTYYLPKNINTPFAQLTYKNFKKFGDVWFPQVVVDTNYQKDGTLKNRTTVEVIAAEFNVDFPKDFFQIDKDYYTLPDTGLHPDREHSSENLATSNDPLLLLCGPQSLFHICELLKVDTNLDELKKLSSFDPHRGTTMLGLKKAATYKGLAPTGVRATVELLKRNKVPLPAIAYLHADHFLVFESVNDEGIEINDPAKKYDQHLIWDELTDLWDGDLLIFDKEKARRTKQQSTPLAYTQNPIHDFGKALGGSIIKHTFNIKNIGKKPLEILSVTETCTCTASVLTQEKIPPGKTGSISSILTVPSGNGQIQERLLVLTNDSTQNTLTLTLKGEMFTPLKTFPELIAFGKQKLLNNPLTKQISLHVQEGAEIKSVRTDSKYINVIMKTKNNIPHVDVQLLPTLPVGKFSHHVLVDYIYNGDQATHNVATFGEIIGELRVVPNRLFFGLIKDPTSFSKTITISSLNTEPFQVTTVESNTKAVKFEIKGDDKKTDYKLTATISSEAKPGEISGEVVIHTSSSVQPTVRVPFFGIIAGSN